MPRVASTAALSWPTLVPGSPSSWKLSPLTVRKVTFMEAPARWRFAGRVGLAVNSRVRLPRRCRGAAAEEDRGERPRAESWSQRSRTDWVRKSAHESSEGVRTAQGWPKVGMRTPIAAVVLG
eukprot:365042-Chlamydomonas_euryale.AAC.23